MTDPLPTAGCLLPTAHYEAPSAYCEPPTACCARKFVLIDHSITDTGGHHLEYALRVLQSAERQGYQPVLATNRKLRGAELAGKVMEARRVSEGEPASSLAHASGFQGEQLPWRVLPVYRYGFWLQSAPSRARAFTQSVRAVARRWPAISRRAFAWRKQAAFAADSLRLFRSVKLAEGDVVFIPTLAEPEMLGLLKLFEREPLSAAATWHLLFRRDIYVGRDPDYAAQDERQRPLRNAFQRFLAGLSGQRVRFYTDTERLTDQYNRLGVATFRTAPIPVAADYRPGSLEDGLPAWGDLPRSPKSQLDGLHRHPRPRRAHIVYIGDARTEKGYHHLPRLVADLAADGPPVRFTFQSNFNIPGGEPAPAAARAQLAAFPQGQVRLVTEPMNSEEYRRLLLDADVVLIPYDRDNYYARSSGVFAEALVAGKPVVVPAGTWMATELAPAIAAWHRAARKRCRVLASLGPGAVRWRTREDSRLRTVPDAPLPVFGESPSFCSLFVPTGATHLLVTFRLPGGGRGVFPGLALEQFGPAADSIRHRSSHATRHTPHATHRACLARDLSIVGGVEECSVLLSLHHGAHRLELQLGNALSPLPLEIQDPRIEFLRAAGPLPLSAVGAVCAEPNQLAAQARELLVYRAHYHATARHFSRAWSRQHSPVGLIDSLRSAADRKRVAAARQDCTTDDERSEERPLAVCSAHRAENQPFTFRGAIRLTRQHKRLQAPARRNQM